MIPRLVLMALLIVGALVLLRLAVVALELGEVLYLGGH